MFVEGDADSLRKVFDFTRNYDSLKFTNVPNLIFEIVVKQTDIDSNLYVVLSRDMLAQVLLASNIRDTRDVIPVKFNRTGQFEVNQVPVASVQHAYSADEKRQILTYIRSKITNRVNLHEMMRGTAVIPESGRIIVLRVQNHDSVGINIGLQTDEKRFIVANPIWFIDESVIKHPKQGDARAFEEYALALTGENSQVTWEYLDNISLQANSLTARLPAAEIFAFLQANTVGGVVRNQDAVFRLLDLDKQMEEEMKRFKGNVSGLNLAFSETHVPVFPGTRERVFEFMQGERPRIPLPPLVKRPTAATRRPLPQPTAVARQANDEVMLVRSDVETSPEIEGRTVYVLKSDYGNSILVASALAGNNEIIKIDDLNMFLQSGAAKTAVIVLSPSIMEGFLRSIGIPEETPVAKILLDR